MGDDCPPVPHCYENKTKSKVFSLEMSVQNFRFLARLVVAEKFVVVGWDGVVVVVVVQAKFRVQL